MTGVLEGKSEGKSEGRIGGAAPDGGACVPWKFRALHDASWVGNF